jgi:hypothetical protein
VVVSVIGAKSHRHHVLHVLDGKAVARELGAVGVDIEIVATDHTLGEGTGGAGHRAHHCLDLAGEPFDFGEVLAVNLDSDGGADAGREHVDARLDRHRPRIGQAGKL